MNDLLPCPWCNSAPTIEPWHGGGPQKRFIQCSNEDCAVSPSVTGSTAAKATAKWNTRTLAPAALSPQGVVLAAELIECCRHLRSHYPVKADVSGITEQRLAALAAAMGGQS